MRVEPSTSWSGAFAPTPKAADLATEPVGLIAMARKASENLLAVMPDETRHKTYVRGPGKIHYVCDPDMVTELLVGEGRTFPKASFTRSVIGSAVGNGLILSEGAKWKAQRRRYSPLFAARNLPVMVRHFAETGRETVQHLRDMTNPVDIADIAQEATLTDISRVMFSGTETVSPEAVREALRRYTDHIAHMSLFDLMGLPSWVPRLKWLRGNEPVRQVRSLGARVIESRRAEARTEPQDFLDLMIAALDEDFEDLDTTVDNLLTFVVAGYETAANTIAWGMYLLALYPDVQTEIRYEILEACPDGNITFERLEAMPRLLAHIRETMRLYPAGALFARDASFDLTIKDVTIRKGDVVMFPVYALHRNTQLWDDADSYRPDRFLNRKYPRGQYIPFGDGPRVCIGAQYAETEIMVLIASLLQEMSFGLGDAPVPDPVLTFTMRPGGPIELTTAPVTTVF